MKAPRRSRAPALLAAAFGLSCAAGCGGGSPLFHGAQALPAGETSFGAGASARVATLDEPAADARSSRILEDLGFGAGVAPWGGARIGIEGGNEAGLAYTGRSIRLDFRHAFQIGGGWALSLGAGGSAIVPRYQGEGLGDEASAYGPGLDVPVLVGRDLGPGLYSIWFGPRAGYDHLSGSFSSRLLQPAQPEESLDLDGHHFWAGGVVGVKVGFRRVHVALEVDGAWHHGQGELGGENASFDQVSITPGGALIVSF